MTETPKAARTERAAPGRRLVAAGFIRRLAGRTLTVCVTEAGVTGRLSRSERVAELHRLARADYEQGADRRAADHYDLFLVAEAAGVVASR